MARRRARSRLLPAYRTSTRGCCGPSRTRERQTSPPRPRDVACACRRRPAREQRKLRHVKQVRVCVCATSVRAWSRTGASARFDWCIFCK